MKSSLLLRLTALRLKPAVMAEVCAIISEIEAPIEARKAKDRDRKPRKIHGKSMENPQTFQGNSTHVSVENPSPVSLQPSINKQDSLNNNDSFLLTSSDSSLEKEEGVVVTRERKSRANPAGHRLPDDWEVPQSVVNLAVSLLFSDKEIPQEIESFRDHWRASSLPTAKKSDWDAAARNWFRKAAKMRKSPIINGNAPRPGSWADRAERSHSAYEKLSEYVESHSDVPSGSSGSSEETAPGLRLIGGS